MKTEICDKRPIQTINSTCHSVVQPDYIYLAGTLLDLSHTHTAMLFTTVVSRAGDGPLRLQLCDSPGHAQPIRQSQKSGFL